MLQTNTFDFVTINEAIKNELRKYLSEDEISILEKEYGFKYKKD